MINQTNLPLNIGLFKGRGSSVVYKWIKNTFCEGMYYLGAWGVQNKHVKVMYMYYTFSAKTYFTA